MPEDLVENSHFLIGELDPIKGAQRKVAARGLDGLHGPPLAPSPPIPLIQMYDSQ